MRTAHRRGIVEELEKAHIYIQQLHEQNKELAAELARMQKMFADRLAELEGVLTEGQ
jgi:hypothetical protein